MTKNTKIELSKQIKAMSFTGKQIRALATSRDDKAIRVFDKLVELVTQDSYEIYCGFSGSREIPKFLTKPAVASRLAKAPNKFNGRYEAIVELAYGPKLNEHRQAVRFGGTVAEKPAVEPSVEADTTQINDLAFLEDLDI